MVKYLKIIHILNNLKLQNHARGSVIERSQCTDYYVEEYTKILKKYVCQVKIQKVSEEG